MKSVYVILLTGMMTISSVLLAQTRNDIVFTTSADLAKAKSKYPPPSDKDKQEIKNVISAESAAYPKGDTEAILSSYSDQAIEVYPNQMVNAGSGNIRNRINGQFKYGSFTRMDRTVESIEGAGPIALVVGKTKAAFKSSSDGKTYEDSGDDIFLLRKQEGGQWKILVHHWFSGNAPVSKSDDASRIRQLINRWSFFAKPGEVLSQTHLDNYVSNFSPQAIEFLPDQWSNFGIANIKLRNSGAIGATWAQCVGYDFDINSFTAIGTAGSSKRAIAWGIGDHSNYSKGSDKLSQYLFPWVMILTKDAEGEWKILVYHFYLG